MAKLKVLALAVVALLGSGCGKRKTETVERPTSESPAPPETTAAPTPPTPPATTSAAPPASLGEVTIGRVASDVPVPDAALVVGTLKEDFARCYDATIASASGKPPIGRLDLVLVVEPTGSLVGKPTADRSSMPPSLGQCIEGKAAGVRFPGFAGRRATLRTPISFALKK